MPGIRANPIGVRNKEGDDFLVMLLDRKIVDKLQTIGYCADTRLVCNYAFAIIFENSFAAKRETGIHHHIKRIEYDESSELEHFGRMALPVRAYLDISLSYYEKLRKTLPRHRDSPALPELQTLTLG